ncbi:kinase-like domain-containing protein [Bisporella sp. PMI_857]|nr:kinase-like domain-containing protein [Bisporella sp. PMI_857]
MITMPKEGKPLEDNTTLESSATLKMALNTALDGSKMLPGMASATWKKAKVTLFARGGYNEVWLVTLKEGLFDSKLLTEAKDDRAIPKCVLRRPTRDTLLPYQVTNEVAYRTFIASRLPHIPVPKVYTYAATSCPSTSFILESFVPGTPLSQLWMTYTSAEKTSIAHKIASIVLDLAEIRFPSIGGLDPIGFSCAPTVEGCKIFKGRRNFHRQECYDIGPYKSVEEYVRAYYDKEIYYYSNGVISDFDDDSIEEESQRNKWIAQLKERREKLERWKVRKEPFVLVHGDLHGRNILMKDGEIAAVLDWEFAGSYPLSEAISCTDVDVVEADSEELDEENKIGIARTEMMPEFSDGD